MSRTTLSYTVRKSLSIQLGEAAGKEVADLLQQLSDRIDYLEKSKVDVTPIIKMPTTNYDSSLPRRRAA